MALVTYPLNNLDYTAEDAELFHCTRSSGIYANDDFGFTVTGTDNTVTIGTGIAWIRNSKFSGTVQELGQEIHIRQSIGAKAIGLLQIPNHKTGYLAFVADTDEHGDFSGIAIGYGMTPIPMLRISS